MPKHDAPEPIKRPDWPNQPEGNKTLDKEDFPGGERPRLDQSVPKGDTPGHLDNGGDHDRPSRAEMERPPEKGDARRPYQAKDSQKKQVAAD